MPKGDRGGKHSRSEMRVSKPAVKVIKTNAYGYENIASMTMKTYRKLSSSVSIVSKHVDISRGQMKHIQKNHSKDVDDVFRNAKQTINKPDKVMTDSRDINTLLFVKRVGDSKYVLLSVGINKEYGGSTKNARIISGRVIGEKTLEKMKRKKDHITGENRFKDILNT